MQGNIFLKTINNQPVAAVYLTDPVDGTRMGPAVQLPNGSTVLVDGNDLTAGPNNTEFVRSGSLILIVVHASDSTYNSKIAETVQPITVTIS